MCGVSHTLLHPGGRAIPASGRNPAQDGGPREGLGPVGTPTQAMTSDSAWPLPRPLGSIKHGEILRGGVVVCVRCGCLHAECSCYLTPPTSRLDGPPSVPRPHPHDLASCFSTKPPAWSHLLLHSRPLDSSLLHSSSFCLEHNLHTCGYGQNNAAIVGCCTTEHPSPKTPRYRKL